MSLVNAASLLCSYVQLVMYLIENKMSSLSGRPQKIVVNILEEIVSQGTLQMAVVRNLWQSNIAPLLCYSSHIQLHKYVSTCIGINIVQNFMLLSK